MLNIRIYYLEIFHISDSSHCFSSDDSASAASSMEVTDRIASLEQRVQMQEDEIQLLKSALADVVRRLNLSEEQQAMGSRRGPTKGNIQHICLFFSFFLMGVSSKRTVRFCGITVTCRYRCTHFQ